MSSFTLNNKNAMITESIKQTKAAILVEQKKPLIVDTIEMPELKYGQVLVKVLYSGICGAQLNEIEGTKGPDKFLPHLLGHEGSGIVLECGEGVTQVQKNDRVVLHWRKNNGIQSATTSYTWQGKKLNAGWVTTFNQHAIVSENRITKIHSESDMKIAPLYGCAITTAFGVIHNNASLKSGESIIIFGAGGVGSAIVLAASVAGAYPIIAIDINDMKLDYAKKCGATHTMNSTKADVRKIMHETLPEMADCVVDTTGIKDVRELAYELTNSTGRTILVGVPKAGEKISIDSFPLHFTKRITGSHGGDAQPDYDIPRLMRLQKAGKLNLSHLITHEYPLEKINEAIDALRQGKTMRCIIALHHE